MAGIDHFNCFNAINTSTGAPTAYAFPASATTEYSPNEIDFGAGKDAWGNALAHPSAGVGTPLFLNIVFPQAASTGSSPTLTINLVAGTATTPTTVVQIICSLVAAATITAGYKMSVSLNIKPEFARFIRLQVVAGTAGFTAGTYIAWISMSPVSDV